MKLSEEEKWFYCPDKECYYCHKELSDEDYGTKNKIITGCAFCNRSFVE